MDTTDTVATETLERHQLSQSYGGRTPGLTFVQGIRCSCGRRFTEAGAMLHLVEMGVEAGVAAMAELHERQAETERQELTPQEKAERELAGYLGGMLHTGRAIGPEWRDQLSLLVDWASQASRVTTPQALAAGGRLWLELERLEGIDATRNDGAELEPGDVRWSDIGPKTREALERLARNA